MYREIVVTARRRDERLQDVPVSVSAFSAEALARSTIQTVADINTITPGFRAGAEGGKENASISLRGIGQVPLGEASPGVVTYFADIPLRSEEHTSELQSLMRISYAVFCLKKNK